MGAAQILVFERRIDALHTALRAAEAKATANAHRADAYAAALMRFVEDMRRVSRFSRLHRPPKTRRP